MREYAKDSNIGFLDACNCHEIDNSSEYTDIQRHGYDYECASKC